MRAIIVFILVISAILIAGSLLAYPLYLLLSPFTDLGFHKYVHFSILLGGLALCIYYLKASDQQTVFGLRQPLRERRQIFVKSVLLGIFILLVVECLLYALGMRTLDPRLINDGVSGFTIAVIKGLVTGILVGVIEETIYRGAIFSGLQKYSNTLIAVVCSSLFYASVHFIEFTDVPTGTVINPLDGFAMLTSGFFMFSDPLIYDSFITLFILGVLFCLVRIRTGSIVACIGLHAGIVAMNKIMNYSTDYKAGSNLEFLINDYDKLNGWLASACLLIACVLFYHSISKAAK